MLESIFQAMVSVKLTSTVTRRKDKQTVKKRNYYVANQFLLMILENFGVIMKNLFYVFAL